MASSARKRRAQLHGHDSHARWQTALREQCQGAMQQRKQQLLWTLRHQTPSSAGIKVGPVPAQACGLTHQACWANMQPQHASCWPVQGPKCMHACQPH